MMSLNPISKQYTPDDYKEVVNELPKHGKVKIKEHREMDYDGTVNDVYILQYITRLDKKELIKMLNNMLYPLLSISVKKVR